ncbi:spermatogenesis-associated protein 22 isoform X3 [Lissotriton helveticus]
MAVSMKRLQLSPVARGLSLVLLFCLHLSSAEQGTDTPSVLHRRFEYKYSFKGPHLVHSDGSVPFWIHSGSYLPVPLFNQKKRNRQPLTSNPQKNEPSTKSMDNFYDHFDFSPLSEGNAWENREPPLKYQERLVNYGSKEEKLPNDQEAWNRNECLSIKRRSDFVSDSEMLQGHMSTLGVTHQQRVPQQYKMPAQTQKMTEQKGLLTGWPNNSSSATSKPQNQKSLYTFKHNQQPKVNDNICVVQEGVNSQNVHKYQLNLSEKDNSLRIISAVIESMKHWSQHTDRAALLFEVLATLDSAVASGRHSAKTFLLRDGKDTLPCIFYETDRELPRLIRGRVHRCMGNYDKKRNLFKCVSVRPASVAEQRTFPEFIKASDAEIKQYVKSLHEI